MANSVSNDALWEKLLEISEQIKNGQKAENTPDFSGVKEEIFDEIERQTAKLGLHYDLNHKANEENWKTTDEDVKKILNTVSLIRKQQREAAEQLPDSDTGQQLEALETQAKDDRAYFNLRFFKLRKTSVVITLLGLLVLTLTLFCMKQQNDYTLLLDEFYRLTLENRLE